MSRIEEHRVGEDVREVLFMGNLNVLDLAGEAGGLFPALIAEQQHLGPGGSGVADEMDAVERHIGQQADTNGAGRPDVVAERAGQQDAPNIQVLQAQLVEKNSAAGPDGGLGELHFPYVPLSSVLPRAAAVVHHGGIGTTGQAFAAGIPQLVVPFTDDQSDNAARVQRTGAGVTMSL
ncbi:MAG: hypothetical protein EHM35_03255, partial [Planctomycetaceae bacterium]